MLNREQNHSQVLLINIQAFIKEGKQDGPIPCPLILWEESSKTWINVRIFFLYEYRPHLTTFVCLDNSCEAQSV